MYHSSRPCQSHQVEANKLYRGYYMSSRVIWAASGQNQQNGMCAQRRLRWAWASAQSDQSSLCAQWIAKDSSFLHADSKDSDQTERMPRLIWVFAGHINHFVGFVMRRLIWIFRASAVTGILLVVLGTAEERGIAAWREDLEITEEPTIEYLEGTEVYEPLLPEKVKSSKLMKYLPIFPYNKDKKDSKYQLDRRPSCMLEISSDAWERRRSSVRRQSLGAGLYL